MKTTTTATIAAAAALMTAAPAAADDQGYVAEIRGMGAPINPFASDGQLLGDGYNICMNLRNGTPREVGINATGWAFRPWAEQWVSAAQNQLCPDTL